MPTNFPTSLDTLSNPTGTTETTDPTLLHSAQHTNANDAIEAIEAKLGIGAAIALDKLAHVGTGNVLKSNGTTNVAGKIVSADITDGTIVNTDIAVQGIIGGSGGAGVSRISPGTIYGSIDLQDGSVNGAKIAAQTITGASVGAGMHIGYRTIYGEQAGGNSNIALGSITGANLQNNTISGSWSGAGTGQILATSIHGARDLVVGSIDTTRLAANAATRVWTDMQGAGVSSGPGVWAWTGQYISASGLTNGDLMLIFLTAPASTTSTTPGQSLYMGIGVDSTSTPGNFIVTGSSVGPNYNLPLTLVCAHTATTTGHSYYVLWYSTAGSIQRGGVHNLTVLQLKR